MRRILGFTALSILTAMACAYYWRLHSMPYYLSITGKSSTDSIAQVYYDAGNGYREEYSVKTSVNKSTTFETLIFALPAQKIKSLRLDPLASEGIMEIKEATVNDSNKILHEFDLRSNFKAVNDISLNISPKETLIALAPEGSIDPIIEIKLSTPLDDWGELDFLDEKWLHQTIFVSFMITPLILALALQRDSKGNELAND